MVDKRLKQRWKLYAVGKLPLTVRYGAKAIEFAEGKDAVVLANVRGRPHQRRDEGETAGGDQAQGAACNSKPR